MFSVITFTVTGLAAATDGMSRIAKPSALTRATMRRDIRTSCGGRSAKPIPRRLDANQGFLPESVVTSDGMGTPVEVGESKLSRR